MRQQVVINWGVSSFYGWGILGLNLAMQWAGDDDIEAMCAFKIEPGAIAVHPAQNHALKPFLDRSAALYQELQGYRDGYCEAHIPVLASLDHEFKLSGPFERNIRLGGRPTIGVTFFESAHIDATALERLRQLPAIVVASGWNCNVLQAYGLRNVETVWQGIDPALFYPAPPAGILADRFCVFSGGKLEYRKGQDIVVAAFARFAQRHPEALLVTAWHSPWPHLARSLDSSELASPMRFSASNAVDIAAWVAANGIDPLQVVDLGAVPNAEIGTMMREMDLAVFPNRCEGGTNQVAMECMACGVPVILSRNTGHLDLIEDDNCFVLEQQADLDGPRAALGDVKGWGESNVDELDALMERAFQDRVEARSRGQRGAAHLSRFTWANTAAQMKRVIQTYTPSAARPENRPAGFGHQRPPKALSDGSGSEADKVYQ